MTWSTTADARERKSHLRLSDSENFDAERILAAADAEDMRIFNRAKAKEADRLKREGDRLAAETADVKEELWEVARLAKRPDVDPAEVTKRHSAVQRRASALPQGIATYSRDAEAFNADLDKPLAWADAFRRKWSSGPGGESFLQWFPW